MANDPASASKRVESLTRELLECYEELDVIYRLSRRGLTTLDSKSSVEFILSEAMEAFDADLGWVEPAPGDDALFSRVADHAEPVVVDAVQKALVNGLLAEGKSVVLDRLPQTAGLNGDTFPEAFLCTIIKTDETVYGALCVGRGKGQDNFTAGDLKLARVMASQAAIAIENALLHKKRMEEEQAMIRLQEEMRHASSIQVNLLPKNAPSFPGYDVAGHTLPAQSVGGDYYDFIPVNGNRLALCLGDVSGKGMPAAMLMAHLQAAIRGQTLMEASPSECLVRSNTLLYQSTDYDRFATCFYGILDGSENCLRFSNAGHDRPIHVAGSSELASLDSAGIVLGVMEEVGYQEVTIPFAAGDMMVLYSDGIIDATNPEGEFGLRRLNEIVDQNRDLGSQQLIDRILGAVNTHAGTTPQTDDMTLLIVRRDV